MHPVFHAHLFFRDVFALTGGGFANQRLLFRVQRAGLFGVTVDSRRVAIRTDQRGERLHQVPHRTVHASLVR